MNPLYLDYGQALIMSKATLVLIWVW